MKPNPYPDPEAVRYARRMAELRDELSQADPHSLAARTGAVYTSHGPAQGEFRLPVWGKEMGVSFPGFVAYDPQTNKEAGLFLDFLLLYHFSSPGGAPMTGRWISFSELPDGRFYNQAFQGYTGQELGRAFGSDLAAFEQAARHIGGVPPSPQDGVPGDAAFTFQALPRTPLLVIVWQGDEDFPASYQVLFDASASEYLPTDACAILGSTLTRKLLSARPVS